MLANSRVVFTYQDAAPTVTHIATSQASPWSARGPFQGNTELTITGTNFLPSKYLTVKFGGLDVGNGSAPNDTSHIVGEPGGKVRYISSNMIIATTPIYGPAAQRAQYPPGTLDRVTGQPMTAGAGAILSVMPVYNAAGGLLAVQVVAGGRGYLAPPRLELSGGGGCCANLTAVLSSGAIASVLVSSPGLNFGRGDGALASVVMSSALSRENMTFVTAVTLTSAGSGYLAAPEVTFECPGCSACRSNATVAACR